MNSTEVNEYMDKLGCCLGECQITDDSKSMVRELFEIFSEIEPYNLQISYKEDSFLWIRSSDGAWFGLEMTRLFMLENKGVVLLIT